MTYGSTTMFVPVFASETAYVLKATYVDENITLEVSLNILVDHGELVQGYIDSAIKPESKY